MLATEHPQCPAVSCLPSGRKRYGAAVLNVGSLTMTAFLLTALLWHAVSDPMLDPVPPAPVQVGSWDEALELLRQRGTGGTGDAGTSPDGGK